MARGGRRGITSSSNVIRLPTRPRLGSAQQIVPLRIFRELPACRIEREAPPETLRDDAEEKHLGERPGDTERRPCLLLALAGEDEVGGVVGEAAANLRQRGGHLVHPLLRNDAQRLAVCPTLEGKRLRVDELALALGQRRVGAEVGG